MRRLGIDLGASRIGIAISDELGMLAHPVETIPNDSGFLAKLQKMVIEKGITAIVMGIPRNMDGSYGPAAEKAKLFLSQLKTEFPGVQLIPWDERLTTMEAQRLLHAAGRDVKKSRPVIDQVAAQVILQSYLDSVALAGGSE
jgi:putative Holliday junction resolvase